MVSAANVQLGEGYDRVLVISVADVDDRPNSVDEAAEKLRPASRVVTIAPDEATKAAIGPNVFDPHAARGVGRPAARKRSASPTTCAPSGSTDANRSTARHARSPSA